MRNGYRLVSVNLIFLALAACSSGGGDGGDGVPNPPSPPSSQTDTTPDTYSFAAAEHYFPNTVVTSEPATITGINAAAAISVAGGEYAIDDGDFTTDAGSITNNQTVRLRGAAGAAAGASHEVVLSIGGVDGSFMITTVATGTPADTTPEPFGLPKSDSVNPGDILTSDPITVTGINASTPITVAGGEYRINGGEWTDEPGLVNPGDTVEVRVTAPVTSNSVAEARLCIGGICDIISAITAPAAGEVDIVPAPIDSSAIESDVDDPQAVEPGSTVTYGPIPVSGIGAEVPVSVSGEAEISLDGGDTWILADDASQAVADGASVLVRITAPEFPGMHTQAELSIGGVTTVFAIATAPAEPGNDASPDPVEPPAPETATVGEPIVFPAVTVRGIDAPAPVSLSADPGITAEYRINGGAWLEAGTEVAVVAGQTLEVRVTATADAESGAAVTLTVGDQSVSYVVNIPVAENRAPIADAGSAQSVAPGDVVTLDGSASSDPDGDTLTYQWMQTGGTAVTLDDTAVVSPSFTAPNVVVAETLTFELSVSDGEKTATDNVSINIAPADAGNRAPLADAGAPQVLDEATGIVVTLDGSASSDPDDDALTYQWEQTDTSSIVVILAGADTETATFTAPDVTADTLLTFRLTVSDGEFAATDTASVTIRFVNQVPSVDAGANQTVDENAVVTLQGSANDPDGDIPTLAWTQTGGPDVTLSDATAAQPSFTAPAVTENVSLVFRLTATDSHDFSAADTVTITVQDTNRAPIADAGTNQSVTSGDAVTLDGSASSDPDDGDTLSYQWVQTDETGVNVTLNNANTTAASFTAPEVTELVTLAFTLTVSDGAKSATDTVTIDVSPAGAGNLPPVANAGSDQDHNEGTPIMLDGSASSDPEAGALTYAWTQVDSSGITVDLTGADTATPVFITPDIAADVVLRFRLTVTDDGGLANSDDVNVTVRDVDTTPADFTLGSDTDAEPGSVRGRTVFVTDVDPEVDIPVAIIGDTEHATLSINGVQQPGNNAIARLNDSVNVTLAAGTFSETRSITLSIGGTLGTYSLTTRDIDRIPDSITNAFVDVENVELGAEVISNPVTLSGFDGTLSATLSGHAATVRQFRVNGGDWLSAADVSSGDVIELRRIASADFSTFLNTSPDLRDGGITVASDNWGVTTRAQDTTPDGFTDFPAVTGVDPSIVETPSVHESIPQVVDDFDGPLPVTVTNGEVAVSNDGVFWSEFAAAGMTVNPGERIKVRAMASADFETDVTATVTIGTLSGNFTVTTRAAITEPGDFSFEPKTGVEAGEQVESEAVQIPGIEIPVPVTAVNGDVAISANGMTYGPCVPAALVGPTDWLKVCVTAGTYEETTTANVTIGSLTQDFSVTVRAEDKLAALTDFMDVDDVPVGSTDHVAFTVVSSIDSPQPVAISGDASATFRLSGDTSCAGGPCTYDAGSVGVTVGAGQTVDVRLNAADAYETSTTATITVGSGADMVSKTFTVTTKAQDITPDPFALTIDDPVVVVGNFATFDPISVTGIDDGVPFDAVASNGELLEYRIAPDLTWTAFPGTTLNNNDVLHVRMASPVDGVTSTLNLTIGSTMVSADVTGEAPDDQPDAFTFVDVVDAGWEHQIVSNPVTVSGINVPVAVSLASAGTAELSINGGEWIASGDLAGVTVEQGDELVVRVTAASTASTAVSATLELGMGGSGPASDTFDVATEATDTTPDAFTLTPVTGVEPSSFHFVFNMTFTGIGEGEAPVSTSGGLEYRFTSLLPWMSGDNGDTVTNEGVPLAVRLLASADFDTETVGYLTIGQYTTTFSVTTRPEDKLAALTEFTDLVDVPKASAGHIGSIDVSDTDNPQPITISGDASATFQLSGDANVYDAGSAGVMVAPGQTVTVMLDAADAFAVATMATVTVGTGADQVSKTFTVTTEAQDVEPDGFSFTDVVDAEPSSPEVPVINVSDTYTVTGMNDTASVSISGDSGAEFEIYDNAGAVIRPWGTDAATISNGEKVAVRVNSSTAFGTTTAAELTIGTVTADYDVTTVVDAEGPTIDITFPSVSATLTTAQFITLRGTAGDNDQIAVIFTLDGEGEQVSATSVDGFATWEMVLPLVSGNNSFAITAEDVSGNETSIVHSIERIQEQPRYLSQVLSAGPDHAYLFDRFAVRFLKLQLSTGEITEVARHIPAYSSSAMDVNSDGNQVYYQHFFNTVMLWDADTGEKTLISSPTKGTGSILSSPMDLVLDEAGSRVVWLQAQTLFSIDLATGDRTMISDNSGNFVSDNRLPSSNGRMTVDDDGTLYVTGVDPSVGLRVVQSVDASGNRSTIATSAGGGLPDGIQDLVWVPGADAMAPGKLIIAGRSGTDVELVELDLETSALTTIAFSGDGNVGVPISNGFEVRLSYSADNGLLLTLRNTDIATARYNHEMYAIDLADPVNNRSVVLAPGELRGVRIDSNMNINRLLHVGDSVYTANGSNLAYPIYRIDQTTGDLIEVASDATHDPDIAVGPVVEASAPHLYIVDADKKVFRHDPQDADPGTARTQLASMDVNCSVPVSPLRGIAVDSAGANLYVLDTAERIHRIELSSGDCDVISSSSDAIGMGPDLNTPMSLDIDEAGARLLVTDSSFSQLFAVDLNDGDSDGLPDGHRSVLTEPQAMGRNTSGARVVVDPSGMLLYVGNRNSATAAADSTIAAVSNADNSAFILVDPFQHGEGGRWLGIADVLFYPEEQRALVLDGEDQIIEVDLITGDRVIISR